MSKNPVVAVIGGGAAGFFGAITCAETYPHSKVILIEKARQVLSKVRISGGGRCNVTHACFDPAVLVTNYPRGGKELRGPFSKFQPRNTVAWFESRGVTLKTETDGRMFPITDSSETIIACLLQQARAAGIELRTETAVTDCHKEGNQFVLVLNKGEELRVDRLLIATGGVPKAAPWFDQLGHTIVPPVPSLFTFNVPISPLHELAGISVPQAKLTLGDSGLQQQGPLLITHWGFSGPAVLKLSAWGARFLHDKQYKVELKVNWLPDITEDKMREMLERCRQTHASKLVYGDAPVSMPKNLWKALLLMAGIPSEVRWTMLSKQHLRQLLQVLLASVFQIEGKSTNKDEFVTCGGIKLDEVNFKNMESKICPGLFFAGEVLDIDGVTGGFNFQNAWTTSWLAGQSLGLP